MRNDSRREFLVSAAGCLAVSNWLNAAPLGMPIGFQIYGVREEASKDLAGTLKQVAALGYKRVELCSFPGYANSGFGPLASMKPEDVRKTIEDTGMQGESCHFQFREYEPAMIDQSIAYAKALGLKYMIMSSPKEGARNANVTMDQWKWNFDHMNEVADESSRPECSSDITITATNGRPLTAFWSMTHCCEASIPNWCNCKWTWEERSLRGTIRSNISQGIQAGSVLFTSKMPNQGRQAAALWNLVKETLIGIAFSAPLRLPALKDISSKWRSAHRRIR